jgi:signal transduction histidine kinase
LIKSEVSMAASGRTQSSHPAREDGRRDEINLRALKPLLFFVQENHGRTMLERISDAAGVNTSDLDGRSCWVSLEQFEVVLAEARKLVDSDEAFLDACGYGFKEEPTWLLHGATTQWTAIQRTVHLAGHVVARICRFEAERHGSRCLIRYQSGRRESHLMCISRQAQIRLMPTLWGMPRARVRMPKCIARGDDCCEYEFDLFENRRWIPAVFGALIAIAAVAVVSRFTHLDLWAWWLLPLVGFLVGNQHELTRAHKANLALARELQDGLERTVEGESEARRELLAFHQRQRDWSRQMEEQLLERTAVLDTVVDNLRQMQLERAGTLRGFTHDIRNPLTLIRCNLDLLARCESRDGEAAQLVSDTQGAVVVMIRLFDQLMASVTALTTSPNLVPQELVIDPLVDRLRRRVSALVHGRDVKASTFKTREAPDAVLVDELLFDRVVDNLLTNAAKYTERGSIIVEVGGAPGFLIIKVSDTGRGIAADQMSKVFQPYGSDVQSRAESSFGVGLSVVVQLLARAGGKLDVMSKSDEGTTFWAHFPVRPPSKPVLLPALLSPTRESQEDLIGRVVSIRSRVSK